MGLFAKVHKVGLFFKHCLFGFNIKTHCVKYLQGHRMSAVLDSLVNTQVPRTTEVSFRRFCAQI